MQPLMFALYVGPDQVMPVMSILATIAGVIMVFWNKVMSIVRRILGVKSAAAPETAPGPSPAAQWKSSPCSLRTIQSDRNSLDPL